MYKYVPDMDAQEPNEHGSAQDNPPQCGHCLEVNFWRGTDYDEKVKTCHRCGKPNRVWSYRLWVVEPVKKVKA